jgi:aminoglycoside phosphotransferase (APT) family kinase protein
MAMITANSLTIDVDRHDMQPAERARAHPRPEQPDARLMWAACQAVGRRSQYSDLPSWRVLSRIERRRSTVFECAVGWPPGAASDVKVFYKADYVSPDAPPDKRRRDIQRFSSALEREAALAPSVAKGLAALGVQSDELVALDVERLAAVRRAVPGRPLGSLGATALRSPQAFTAVFSRVGLALRAIEAAGTSITGPAPERSPEDHLGWRVQNASEVLEPSQRSWLVKVVASLPSAEPAPMRWLWAHNDVSLTNILVHRGGLGLIDFSWREGYPFHDLAHLRARLETSALPHRGLARRAVAALEQGAGVQSGASRTLVDLALLERALRYLPKRRHPTTTWGRAVIERLRLPGPNQLRLL